MKILADFHISRLESANRGFYELILTTRRNTTRNEASKVPEVAGEEGFVTLKFRTYFGL